MTAREKSLFTSAILVTLQTLVALVVLSAALWFAIKGWLR